MRRSRRVSAYHSPGAGRRPQPSAHMAPNVTEPQHFPKRKNSRPGKRDGLDTASPLLVPSLLGPVHCTHRARSGPDSISLHKLSSAGVKGCAKCQQGALLPVLPPGQREDTILHRRHGRQLHSGSNGAAGPAWARLLPDASIAGLALSHRLRAADDSGY